MDDLTPNTAESYPQIDQGISENISCSAPVTLPHENSPYSEVDSSNPVFSSPLGEKEHIQVQTPSYCDSKTLTDSHSVPSDTSSIAHLNACTDAPTRAVTTLPHTDFIYHIKWITFQGNRRPVVTQNENGPCPIIAIANVLLLRGAVNISEDCEIISGHRLVALLSDFLLSQSVSYLDDGQLLNYETTVSDALNLFPRLQTGLDVNVRFTGVTSFEYTPALGVFDLFKIPIYHGWLVDPENSDLVSVVGNLTYNQLVERIIRLKASSDPGNVAKGVVAEDFLHSTASQLTYHGLFILSSAVSDDQLAVFFRNNHFNTITKHDGRIYVLVTDMGLLSEPNVVWEVLNDVDGDTEFVDSAFHLYSPETASSTTIPPSSAAPDSDRYASGGGKLDLSNKNSADGLPKCSPEQAFSHAEHESVTDSDIDLALRLQLEEMDTSGGRKPPARTRGTDSNTEPPLASNPSTSASHRMHHHHPFATVPSRRPSTGGDRRDCRLL